MTAESAFAGVWCPSVTPFNAQGAIDIDALGRHFSRLNRSGIDTLLIMGSIGEFASLTQQERLQLIKEARPLSPLTMVANVSATCVADMLSLAEAAWESGYDAVMVLPPYYYGQTQNQLMHYFETLDQQLGGKWFAYNFPARTGCDLSPTLVAALAAKLPNFIGIKDTVDCLSHNRAMIDETKKVRSDFAVLSGYDEYLLPNLLAGGAGVISGLNNIVPEVFAQMMQAWRDGNMAELTRIQQQIGRMMAIYSIGDDFVTTIKTAVSRRYDSMRSASRNYGGTLDAQQCAALDRLFS
ncbi:MULTISPECIES: dihydrodipicolinate synthase family protein [Pantoea]|jgi:4-hydroxy-tetrahydrodipicolinate synthase|uniref:Dihydrodipicolinate synthase n=1 Tax=Pantoea brenneri TaxID=472694 RepID=A0A653QRK3_9GAMM|nr:MULTISPECIES: dihydrodipicolinate synthase family protein [Pantoea]KKD30254.1 dihydrodipicolinate synthase [Pantoea sp. 3.5.1]MBZ6395549.1 dihydrodipicolinate synthase family protein [Pantoea sp.]MBZ6439173.1 dihydrodipicolinate synthase family protein [Pantoea sp.]MCQ5469732.1 dihydrodipicolinate synthase family protein [Pantoea brenneri]MDH1088278.1 dihydrodipicolinate synthase family protein [Pantoea brenneri]